MGTHKGLKVLLIDDDPGILKVMTIALEDEGYTVISANDGESRLIELIRLNRLSKDAKR
ncbi:MAG: hypothetical protein ABSF90_21390 [Syntrophobacteraceae bacterium]|jgi:DNA-binding response OmpR family regulator